jgi:leucyl aminopeptidase
VVRGRITTSAQVRRPGAGVVAVPVAPGSEDGEEDGVQPRLGAADAAVRYGVDLAEWATRRRFKAKAGQALALNLPVLHRADAARDLGWDELAPRVVLVGVGDGSVASARLAGAALAKRTAGDGTVVTTVAQDSPEHTAALVEGYLLGAYRVQREGLKPAEPANGDLVLLGRYEREAADLGVWAAQAQWLARDLTRWPSNHKYPASLAGAFEQAAAGVPGLTVEVWPPDRLATEGFGALLAVGAGAGQERGPRLAIVRYEPLAAGPSAPVPHVALVGKGVTFDTGGLDIKPGESMATMTTDMAGSAAVFAATLAVAQAGLPVRLTAVLPLAQNSVGAASFRPGDIVRTYGGQTVEVGDTDAEGRLVLADALAWVDAVVQPDAVVDIATLTGAARLALGRETGVLLASDDPLAQRLLAAGEAAGEGWWRLPLVEAYREALTSPIAQTSSTGKPGTGAGAITAALFLQRFAGARPWAHLDIAGPARAASGSDFGPAGGTGFGVRTLLGYLRGLV